MGSGNETTVNCRGRFNELRDFIYQVALPTVIPADETNMTLRNLEEIWDLSQDDIVTGGFNRLDPYFFCRSYTSGTGLSVKEKKGTDDLRWSPEISLWSIVPLIESHIDLEGGLVFNYAFRSMDNSRQVSEKLESMTNRSSTYLKDMGKQSKDIVFPRRVNLSGYRVAANYGIGSLCAGGLKGGGIRSDSPFLLEISKVDRDGSNLAAVVGFWAQNDEMIISQMQSCKNAQLPRGVPFGVACYRIAEAAAETIGFKGIRSYSAVNHPLFKQHPSSWDQLQTEFVRIYDSSAKKLGYDGGRTENHYKKINAGE